MQPGQLCRVTRPPGPSPGYLVPAAAPAALLAAQQLRDGQRGRVRLVRGGGQAHVGAGTAADAQKKAGGAEKASADRTAGLRAAAPQAARTSAAVRRGQTSRAAPPPPSLRRPSGRPRQCRPAAPRGSARLAPRGGRWWAVGRGPAKNNLEHRSSLPGANSHVQNWLGGLALRLGDEARAPQASIKANALLSPASTTESLPSLLPTRIHLPCAEAQPTSLRTDTTWKNQVRFTFYKPLKSPWAFPVMRKQR